MTPRFEAQNPGSGVRTIQGYGQGGFRAGGAVYAGAVLVTPEAVQAWPVGALDTLVADDFASLFAADIEVVLIGTGMAMRRPPKLLLDELRARGLAPEFMDSKAAARTYNVLVAEGRRVAAALLPL